MRSGLVMAWRLATWPTMRSPSLEKATTEGVVRLPSALGMTTASPPSMTATQLLVVPKSIPMILDIMSSSNMKRLFYIEKDRTCGYAVSVSACHPAGFPGSSLLVGHLHHGEADDLLAQLKPAWNTSATVFSPRLSSSTCITAL